MSVASSQQNLEWKKKASLLLEDLISKVWDGK